MHFSYDTQNLLNIKVDKRGKEKRFSVWRIQRGRDWIRDG